jgi:hypothetical protein
MRVQSLIITACIVLVGATVHAAPLKLSVGVKPWLAEWKTSSSSGSFQSRLGAMYGPALILRYGSFFAGATYLRGAFPVPLSSSTVGSTQDADTMRIDTDLTVGYYLNPYFGLVGGYKYIDFTISFPPGSPAQEQTQRMEGPFGGILASYPLGRTGFATYGAFTYSGLTRRSKVGTIESQGDFQGPSVEVGLAYRVPKSALTFAEGYKFQRFVDRAAQTSDTFQGLLFNMAYTF